MLRLDRADAARAAIGGRAAALGLPLEPLDWVGRQVQEDLVLVRADAARTADVLRQFAKEQGIEYFYDVGTPRQVLPSTPGRLSLARRVPHDDLDSEVSFRFS